MVTAYEQYDDPLNQGFHVHLSPEHHAAKCSADRRVLDPLNLKDAEGLFARQVNVEIFRR